MIPTLIFLAALSFVLYTFLYYKSGLSIEFMKTWKHVHVFFTVVVFYIVCYYNPQFGFYDLFYCVFAWGAVTDIRFTMPCIGGAIVTAIFQSLTGG